MNSSESQGPDQPPSLERVEGIKQQLIAFSLQHGIPSLEDRIHYGMDPIGILALPETSAKVLALCQKIGGSQQAGASISEQLLKMCLQIQVAGPWGFAEQLKNASEPYIKAWMILKASNRIPREMKLSAPQLLQHLETIQKELDEAISDPEVYFESKAKNQVLVQSQTRFREPEANVPITELDDGFTAMAINGKKAGIMQDADGMLYIGSSVPVGTELFEKWGLKAEKRKDRGRDVTVFINSRGEILAKRIHPGFIVVLSRSFRLAAEIVKAINNPDTVQPVAPEILGHILYAPTSLDTSATEEERERLRKEGDKELEEIFSLEGVRELGTFADRFYRAFTLVKSHVIFTDATIALQKKHAQDASKKSERTGKPVDPKQVSGEDLVKLRIKTEAKVAQKADELRYMMKLLGPEIDQLDKNITVVLDMAGGAGDVAMVATMTMMGKGHAITEARIIDPFAEEMREFTERILHYLPNSEAFQKVIKISPITLQEAPITPNAMVMAKHACGTLTDDIIEQWVESESPVLCIMTCCQDKAKDHPARYDISQEDWYQWCKASSKTNSDNPEQRAEGMKAMLKLDEARIAYLRRHGFDAELHQNPAFPKGDVIIAKRRRKG